MRSEVRNNKLKYLIIETEQKLMITFGNGHCAGSGKFENFVKLS